MFKGVGMVCEIVATVMGMLKNGTSNIVVGYDIV